MLSAVTECLATQSVGWRHVPTRHMVPVGAHWHLLGDSHSDVHVPSAVESPQHLVIGAAVHADQGDPCRLEAGREMGHGLGWEACAVQAAVEWE